MKLKFQPVKLSETLFFENLDPLLFIAKEKELTPNTTCYQNIENNLLFIHISTNFSQSIEW